MSITLKRGRNEKKPSNNEDLRTQIQFKQTKQRDQQAEEEKIFSVPSSHLTSTAKQELEETKKRGNPMLIE